MILNIHGFLSSGDNTKSKILNEYNDVISPTLPLNPKLAFNILNDIIKENKITLIVGTSLGGFYANVLSNKWNIPSVLINPSTKPSETLGKKIGKHLNFKTNKEDELTQDHIDQFKQIENGDLFSLESQKVLLGEFDDVIDPNIADKLFVNADIKWFKDNHRFTKLKKAIESDRQLKEWVTN